MFGNMVRELEETLDGEVKGVEKSLDSVVVPSWDWDRRGLPWVMMNGFPTNAGLRIKRLLGDHRFPRAGDAFGEQPCGRSGWRRLTGCGVEGFRLDVSDETAVLADGL